MPILALVILMILVKRRMLHFISSKIFTVSALFLFIMVISVLFSTYRHISLLAFLNVLEIIIFALLVYLVIQNSRQLAIFLCVWVGCHFVLAVSTLFVDGGETGRVGAGGRAAYSFMGDPNDFAIGLSIAFPFIIYGLAFVKKHRGILVLMLASFLVGFVLSNSRGGAISFLGVSLFMILKTRKKLFYLTVTALCLLWVFAFLPQNFVERMNTIKPSVISDKEDTAQHRIEIWKAGIQMMLNDPLTGVGLERFSAEFGMHYDERQRWRVAHNTYVDIGGETGLIGLIVYLYLLHSIFRENRNIRAKLEANNLDKSGLWFLSNALSAALFAYCIGTLTISAFFYIHLYLLATLTLTVKKILLLEYGFEVER